MFHSDDMYVLHIELGQPTQVITTWDDMKQTTRIAANFTRYSCKLRVIYRVILESKPEDESMITVVIYVGTVAAVCTLALYHVTL